MPGPRRKPTATKSKDTRENKHKPNEKEPSYRLGCPRPPRWLAAKARPTYKRIGKILADQGVIAESDRDALALYCNLEAKYVRLLADMTGELEADPKLIRVMSLLTNDMMKIIREFGFTPATRAKTNADPPKRGGSAGNPAVLSIEEYAAQAKGWKK